jgi:hypothetical protein
MGRPFQDLSGLKFGPLTVVAISGRGINGGARWRCRCDECGSYRVVSSKTLKHYGGTCKCSRDLSGQKFGPLTVVALANRGRKGVPPADLAKKTGSMAMPLRLRK